MEEKLKKYYEIGKQLRNSINSEHCYDCPFKKRCYELYDDETGDWGDWVDCDTIRIKIIEEKLSKNT